MFSNWTISIELKKESDFLWEIGKEIPLILCESDQCETKKL